MLSPRGCFPRCHKPEANRRLHDALQYYPPDDARAGYNAPDKSGDSRIDGGRKSRQFDAAPDIAGHKPGGKTQLETWRAEGTVLEHLGELLAGFNSATSMLENQWMAVKSTIDTTVTQTLRAGMQVVYADIINLIKSMDAGLQENKGTIAAGIVVALESVKTVAASVWNIIQVCGPFSLPSWI